MSVRRTAAADDVPAVADEFFGREREVRRILSLLSGPTRLLTLIGPGGIGKTRLLTETLARLTPAERPVYRVRLARLARGSGPGAIEEELARTIAGADFSGRSAWDAVVDTLRRPAASSGLPPAVLVLDNCEHVLDGAGAVTAELLGAVPELTIVATSRAQLGWVDEHLLPVPPLTRQQAVALFRARAELAGHPVAEPEGIAIAEAICRRLHDHPLPIRMAAAQLSRRPLPALLRELTGEPGDARFDWTAEPGAALDARHRGIGDVIAWSLDLCDDRERLLFERMSVFAAGHEHPPREDPSGQGTGAELGAIVAVCADESGAGIAPGEVEALLERLVDQSLVTLHLTGDSVRYSLLESFRLFAARRLRERVAGREWARLTRRHRRYHRDRVLRAAAGWFGSSESELLEWARTCWDDLDLAVHGGLDDPD